MTRAEKILKKELAGISREEKRKYLYTCKIRLIQAMKEIVFEAMCDNLLLDKIDAFPPDYSWEIISKWCDEKVEAMP